MMFGLVLLIVMFSSWAAVSMWLVLKIIRAKEILGQIATDMATEREITADLLRITKGYAEVVETWHREMLREAVKAKLAAIHTGEQVERVKQSVEQSAAKVEDIKQAVTGTTGQSGVIKAPEC